MGCNDISERSKIVRDPAHVLDNDPSSCNDISERPKIVRLGFVLPLIHLLVLCGVLNLLPSAAATSALGSSR